MLRISFSGTISTASTIDHRQVRRLFRHLHLERRMVCPIIELTATIAPIWPYHIVCRASTRDLYTRSNAMLIGF